MSQYSLGSTIPVIEHSRINKSDVENNTGFRDTAEPNKKSLSGVIAHETMHDQIREKFGLAAYLEIPGWKEEGYCEYIAGETTFSFEQGIKLCKENPNDSSKYEYFKSHQMVRYLLDDEKIGVEDLFSRKLDEEESAKKFLRRFHSKLNNSKLANRLLKNIKNDLYFGRNHLIKIKKGDDKFLLPPFLHYF